MAGPKMGNTYPSAISSYPNWVAHETPYTAEWGNSVGFEFHLIEYELGESPRGSYNSVKDRLDSFPEFSGFNFWARGYYTVATQILGIGTGNLYFDVAEHDYDEVFDLVGRRNITAKVSGWYHVIWNQWVEQAGGNFPNSIKMRVYRSRGGIYAYVGYSMLVIESAGWYTLKVDTSVYLDKDEYIYATIETGADSQVFIRADSQNNVIDFRLVEVKAYDRR